MADRLAFFARSANEPPGKGRHERVTDQRRYAALMNYPNWRRVLSNMHECPFEYEKLTYQTMEHGLQAAKIRLVDPQKAMQFALESGSALSRGDGGAAVQGAKKMVKMSPADIRRWDDMSKAVMESLAKAKYVQCPEALRVLLATWDAELWHIDSSRVGASLVRFDHLERIRDSWAGPLPQYMSRGLSPPFSSTTTSSSPRPSSAPGPSNPRKPSKAPKGAGRTRKTKSQLNADARARIRDAFAIAKNGQMQGRLRERIVELLEGKDKDKPLEDKNYTMMRRLENKAGIKRTKKKNQSSRQPSSRQPSRQPSSRQPSRQPSSRQPSRQPSSRQPSRQPSSRTTSGAFSSPVTSSNQEPSRLNSHASTRKSSRQNRGQTWEAGRQRTGQLFRMDSGGSSVGSIGK